MKCFFCSNAADMMANPNNRQSLTADDFLMIDPSASLYQNDNNVNHKSKRNQPPRKMPVREMVSQLEENIRKNSPSSLQQQPNLNDLRPLGTPTNKPSKIPTPSKRNRKN